MDSEVTTLPATPAPAAAQPAAPEASAAPATEQPATNEPATPVTAVAPPAPAQSAPNSPSAPVTAVASAPKATMLTTIESALRGKTAILAENKVFKQRAEAAESALITTQADLTRVQGELNTLKAEHSQIEGLLSAAQENEQTVVAAATDIVAQSGIPADELPAQEAEGSDFVSEYKAALQAGPTAMGVFMKERRTEVNAYIASNS